MTAPRTDYEREWQRQLSRPDIPARHLPVHRWYLRMEEPQKVAERAAPKGGLTIMRAMRPGIRFYRFLYHTAGEEFLWGDRRRMSDAELLPLIDRDDVHVMVLYDEGVPAGYFEISFNNENESHLKYFALMPGFLGRGLGGYLLNRAIRYAAEIQPVPLKLDTCSLDHFSALENYRKRGFSVYREEDEIYPDPRLDGTIRPDAGAHVPLAVRSQT